MDTHGPRKVYIFDASVFITLHRIDMDSIRLPQSVWDKLDSLLVAGTIISHRFVFEEVVRDSEKPDKISLWLKPRKGYFETTNEKPYLDMVKAVLLKFPKLIDIDNEKNQADPWLVAMGVNKGLEHSDAEYIVVTQENKAKQTKIPAACRDFGVKSISLADFFEEIGVKFNIS